MVFVIKEDRSDLCHYAYKFHKKLQNLTQ